MSSEILMFSVLALFAHFDQTVGVGIVNLNSKLKIIAIEWGCTSLLIFVR